MATYYVKNGGSDSASGLSDALAWATPGKVADVTLSPGDSVLFKGGSLFRGTLGPNQGGTSGSPITFGAYDSGANPIISGAILLTGWTLDSGNIWYATQAADPNWVFMDLTPGVKRTSKAACVAEGEWYWDSAATRLYIYAPTDPDTRYTTPGVEVISLFGIVYATQNWLTFEDLTVEKSGYKCIGAFDQNVEGVEIKSCLLQYSTYAAMEFGYANTGYLITGLKVHDNVARYCGANGLMLVYRVTNSEIYRNNCYGIDTVLDVTTGGAIKIFDNLSVMEGIKIYENYCHDNGPGYGYHDRGIGIWSDAVQPPTNRNQIYHNRIRNSYGSGIFLELTKNTDAWANEVFNCATAPDGDDAFIPAGIKLDCRATTEHLITSDNRIYNNSVYGGRAGISLATYTQDAYCRIDNNLIKNNIAIGQTEHRLSAMEGGDNVTYGTGNVYEYNCFGAEAAGFIEWGMHATKATYDAWETAYDGDTHSIEADPKFTDGPGGDLTLASDSPCKDTGANLGTAYQMALRPGSVWPGQ